VERLADALQVSAGWLAYGIQGPWAPAPELRCNGLAGRLRQRRRELSLSLRDVGQAAGVSAPAVGLLEIESIPTLAVLEDLATALDVSPAWLAYGIGPWDPVRRGARRAEKQATSSAPSSGALR
jgi:hypothetical protein